MIIIGGWLGGQTSSATAIRGNLVKGLGELSARMPSGLAGFGAGLRSSAAVIRWAIFALGLIILLIGDVLSPSSILWTSALVAGLLTLLQLLVGAPEDASTSTTPSDGVPVNA